MYTQQHLNQAVLEAVDFIQAEGWDAPPTLFALVPSRLLIDTLTDPDTANELSLVVQDLPTDVESIGDYVAHVIWPEAVVGAVIAQEILFRDSSEPSTEPVRARLFSAIVKNTELQLTILQIPQDNDGLFGEDDYELRGGPTVAPELISALRASFDHIAED